MVDEVPPLKVTWYDSVVCLICSRNIDPCLKDLILMSPNLPHPILKRLQIVPKRVASLLSDEIYEMTYHIHPVTDRAY